MRQERSVCAALLRARELSCCLRITLQRVRRRWAESASQLRELQGTTMPLSGSCWLPAHVGAAINSTVAPAHRPAEATLADLLD